MILFVTDVKRLRWTHGWTATNNGALFLLFAAPILNHQLIIWIWVYVKDVLSKVEMMISVFISDCTHHTALPYIVYRWYVTLRSSFATISLRFCVPQVTSFRRMKWKQTRPSGYSRVPDKVRPFENIKVFAFINSSLCSISRSFLRNNTCVV